MLRGVLHRHLCFMMALWLLCWFSWLFVDICGWCTYFVFVFVLNLFRGLYIVLWDYLLLFFTSVAPESIAISISSFDRTNWWAKSTYFILPAWVWAALSLATLPLGLVKDLVRGQGWCTRAIIAMLVMHGELVTTTWIVSCQNFILELKTCLLLHFLTLTSKPSWEAFWCVVWGKLTKTIVTLLVWVFLVMLLLDKTVSRKWHVLLLLERRCMVCGNGTGSAWPIYFHTFILFTAIAWLNFLFLSSASVIVIGVWPRWWKALQVQLLVIALLRLGQPTIDAITPTWDPRASRGLLLFIILTECFIYLGKIIPRVHLRELHLYYLASLLSTSCTLWDHCLSLEIFLVQVVHKRARTYLVEELELWEELCGCDRFFTYYWSEKRLLASHQKWVFSLSRLSY